ncbi:IS66 family transposase [Aquimarina aquimarini]|uniref:IS66 family transposase n=1 Tax=Aquimarina aquimarini TaxID=1191734 RepID=UPI000D553A49|nr:transposase [Aquimarina aquimarini]
MIKIVLRLEFAHVFPKEEKKDISEYLNGISKETLLKIIGFFNTTPIPNFDSFFTNPKIAKDIYDRIVVYSHINGIKEKPVLVTRQASLKLVELILSNRETLSKTDEEISVDDLELNLFKSFLLINEELNQNQKTEVTSKGNFEKLVDYSIIFRFPISDLAIFEENENPEFIKLLYTTIIKVEHLFDFLNSNGYTAYLNLKTKGEITLLACMAHARRYFEKALDNDVFRASYALEQIQRLYAIERKAKERDSSYKVTKRYMQSLF